MTVGTFARGQTPAGEYSQHALYPNKSSVLGLVRFGSFGDVEPPPHPLSGLRPSSAHRSGIPRDQG